MTRRILLPAVGLALALILTGCSGGGASTAPPTAAANASAEAPASEVPSTAPTSAPSTAASSAPSASPATAPSEAAPSIALPSFVLPNDDKGLEALLPDELCGKKAIKLSASGTRYEEYQTAIDKALLGQLGKTAADVVFAYASPGAAAGSCHTSAWAYRIKGADPDKLKALFVAVAKQQENITYTMANVGGRDVYVGVSPTIKTKTYAYFNGDALFAVVAPDDASAAKVLAGMP